MKRKLPRQTIRSKIRYTKNLARVPRCAPTPERSAQAEILAVASLAAAHAHDEVFALKHALASVRETVRGELQVLHRQFGPLHEDRTTQTAELEALRWQLAEERRLHHEQRQRADQFEGRTRALESSTSWRITAPFRALILAVRR